MYSVNTNGQLNEQPFKFDSKRWKLRIKIDDSEKENSSCTLILYYLSEQNTMIVKKNKENQIKRIISKNDYCFNLKKGLNILWKQEIEGFKNQDNFCKKMRNLRIDGLDNIRHTWELGNNKNSSFLNQFFRKNFNLILSFYKYPLNNVTPSHLIKHIIEFENSINKKIIEQAQTIADKRDDYSFTVPPNQNFISLIELIKNNKLNFIKFCTKNNFTKGSFL
jgi:hypothetical protein